MLTVSFQGHTLLSEPIMKPISVATVTSCQCLSSHESRCEKETIPATAPTAKIRMTGRFSSPIAVMMYWYFPSRSRMNAPEMPGRIMGADGNRSGQ